MTTYKLILTRKFRIDEYRADDENKVTEITDNFVSALFGVLETFGIESSNTGGEIVNDVEFNDFTFFVSGDQFYSLKLFNRFNELANEGAILYEEIDD